MEFINVVNAGASPTATCQNILREEAAGEACAAWRLMHFDWWHNEAAQ